MKKHDKNCIVENKELVNYILQPFKCECGGMFILTPICGNITTVFQEKCDKCNKTRGEIIY